MFLTMLLVGYINWLCYDYFCSGFAMNSLAKRMGEGRKLHYIIGTVGSLSKSYFHCLRQTNWKVFVLTFTIGLIVAVLRGLLLFHVADFTADMVDFVGSELAYAIYAEEDHDNGYTHDYNYIASKFSPKLTESQSKTNVLPPIPAAVFGLMKYSSKFST